jgi:hypothetical protein
MHKKNHDIQKVFEVSFPSSHGHLSPPQVFSGDRVTRSLVLINDMVNKQNNKLLKFVLSKEKKKMESSSTWNNRNSMCYSIFSFISNDL